MTIDKLCFHDSTIEDIIYSINDQNVSIIISCVQDCHKKDAYKMVSGKLIFKGVKEIVVDDEVSQNISTLLDDGEVLDLKIENGMLEMLVEWIEYKTRRRETKNYLIKAKEIIWEQDEDNSESEWYSYEM